MKLVAYQYEGKAGYGVLSGDRIAAPGKDFLERYPDIRSVLDGAALPKLQEVVTGAPATLALADVELLPPLANPR